MTSARPPARDQPTLEETEALRRELVTTVAERTWLNAASRVVRGPGARRVHVLLDGASATLVLVDLGQVLARRTVHTVWLLEQLGATPRFDDLAAAIDPDEVSR